MSRKPAGLYLLHTRVKVFNKQQSIYVMRHYLILDGVRYIEYGDGVMVIFSGKEYYTEYHDANVQIWRDENGRIVAIDIVYEDKANK